MYSLELSLRNLQMGRLLSPLKTLFST